MIRLVHRPWKISTFSQVNFNINILWKINIYYHHLSSGCYTNQTKPSYTNMIEYFQIIQVSSTSISTSYPPLRIRLTMLHAEAFAHPSVRPITRCAQQHVPAWSHGCMWVKSWLLHNDIHRHQAAAWLVFWMLLLTLYMFLPLHLSIVACCCNHGFQRSKGQRCLFCKDLEHMNPVE